MSALAWLRRPGCSAARPESSDTTARHLRRHLAAALLALPLLALAAGAQAQVLVSNIGQPDGGTVTFEQDHAQLFATGPNAGGYRLGSVDIEFASATRSSAFDSTVLAVEIRRWNNFAPDALVGRLTNPTGTSFSADRLMRFTAQGDGIDLDSAAAYYLVLDVAGQHDADFAQIRTMAANGTQDPGTPGFTLSTPRYRAADSTGGWTNSQQDLKIRLNGTAKAPPGLMPQIMLSQEHFTVDEPQADNCKDSHVGTETTFGTDQHGNPTVTRDYGDVLTSVQYQVQLDRAPGPNKFVSVEIWEPTDLDRPDVRTGYNNDGSIAHTGRFSENARIHGISWRGGQQGRISIANTNSLMNTFLKFDDQNWNQPRTVTVNIHCAQHDVNTPLPIWHFAFRHDDPKPVHSGSKWPYGGTGKPTGLELNRKGDNSSDNTTYRIAHVRVADRTTPAAITGNPDGKLVLDATGSGFTTGGKKMISLEFAWNHPENSLHNDYDDAAEQFAAFRVQLRTVEPAGHPVQEKIVRVSAISRHDSKKTTTSWYAALEAKGHVGWVHGRPEPTDSKYEWSVVPLDRRWNAVEDEQVTKCVLLTSKAGPNGGRASRIDETVNPTCPPAPQNAPALVTPAPTETVSNLQLATVDAASASASWDAVAHATSYEVSWDGSGSQTAVNGAVRVTGTSATIEHGAQEAMTLTLTVTPEYLDNGVTQQLDSLAATATLEIGPQSDALRASAESQPPACVSAELMADARLAASETWRTSPGHVERWSRVLAAFGEENSYSNNPMTITEAQAQADRGLQRWAPVAPALECLANSPQETPQQEEEEEVTPTTPELSLSPGTAITEGGSASFTITADPAPASDLTIAYTVTQSGDFLATPGAGAGR